MAPQALITSGPGPQKKGGTLWTLQSLEHPRTHQPQVKLPHACNDGWVTIGQIVADPETGEEVEEYALYLCRRCNA